MKNMKRILLLWMLFVSISLSAQDWAVKTKSGVITRAMRQRCREALIIARERLSRLKPMPHHFVSYRSALLERILAVHFDEVKNRAWFRAEDFPDVVQEYTPEVHERRFAKF